MAMLRLKITVTEIVSLNTEDYQEQWDEEQEEGAESRPVPADYALEKFREDLDEGNIGLEDVLEEPEVIIETID